MTLRRQMAELHSMVDQLTTLLIVRDPGNALSADAYDGLRKTISLTARSKRSHISHLLSLKESLDRDAPIELIKDRVSDFLSELGVSYFWDTSVADYFELLDGEGDVLECVVPAVVETDVDGNPVLCHKQGKTRRVMSSDAVPQVDPDELCDLESQNSTDTDSDQDSEPQDEDHWGTSILYILTSKRKL